jgi:hypothetical protein
VRGNLAEAVLYRMAMPAWYFCSGCFVIEIGPSVVLLKWLCVSGWRSERGTIARAV